MRDPKVVTKERDEARREYLRITRDGSYDHREAGRLMRIVDERNAELAQIRKGR